MTNENEIAILKAKVTLQEELIIALILVQDNFAQDRISKSYPVIGELIKKIKK